MNRIFLLFCTLFLLLVNSRALSSKEIDCDSFLSQKTAKTVEENFKKIYCHTKNENFSSAKTLTSKEHINKAKTQTPYIVDYLLYYKALAEYKTGNGKSALEILKSLTDSHLPPFINKESLNLLAKIYTDKEEYSSALKIYDNLFN